MKKAQQTNAKRQVLFIQGGGAGVHDEWDNKLVDSLKQNLGSSYDIRYPRMPNEEDPRYATWKPALKKELDALESDAIVVAHSIGATMLVNLLADHSLHRSLGGLFLISAPFVGEGGWSSEELRLPENLGAKLPRDVPIHIYHGFEDEDVPPPHLDLYERAIPRAKTHRAAGRDHQFNNDLSDVAATIESLDRH